MLLHPKIRKHYDIFCALDSEKFEGTIWLPEKKNKNRTIVKIKKVGGSRSVYCEFSTIDDNFLYSYNKSHKTRKIRNIDVSLAGTNFCLEPLPIVISQWYRDKIGVNKNEVVELEIKYISQLNFISKIKACTHHPQVLVRVGTNIAILSLILAFISIAIATLIEPLNQKFILGMACFLGGFLMRLLLEDE